MQETNKNEEFSINKSSAGGGAAEFEQNADTKAYSPKMVNIKDRRRKKIHVRIRIGGISEV